MEEVRREYRVKVEEVVTLEGVKTVKTWERLMDSEAYSKLCDRVRAEEGNFAKVPDQMGYRETERVVQETKTRTLLDATVDQLEIEQVVTAVFDIDECDLRMT